MSSPVRRLGELTRRSVAGLRQRRKWGAGRPSGPASRACGSPDDFSWQNGRAVARARVLLALGSGLVTYIDPTLPPYTDWHFIAMTYGIILLFTLYSLWVWRQEKSRTPPLWVSGLTNWLDPLFIAALISCTGAYESPFDIWIVFTIFGPALKDGWPSAVRVCAVTVALYVAICLPHLGHPDFVLPVFVVRTAFIFVIALVVAHVGQRVIEQNRMLAGAHNAALHISAGRSIRDTLGRIADSLTDLLQAEQVAVSMWQDSSKSPDRSFGNLERHRGERLLELARSRLASVPNTNLPHTLVTNAPDRDSDAGTASGALAGVHNLLMTRLPGSQDRPGVLVACNRHGERGFTRSDVEMAELLAALAAPLLETAHLQEQRRYFAGVDERRRIAAELHDRLIQTLATLDLRILTCSDLDEVRALKELTEEALEEARGAVSDLAPVRLREEGLAAHMKDCVRKFQERVPSPVELSLDLAALDVPEPTALLLIGLLREGLNNVRKHAHASQVEVTMLPHGDQIQFRLADDGVGFRPEECPSLSMPARHYGLAYLRERINAIGGAMSVTSAPGQGTILEATVPVLTEECLLSLISRLPAFSRPNHAAPELHHRRHASALPTRP